MSKYCTQCELENENDAEFCTQCGSKFNTVASVKLDYEIGLLWGLFSFEGRINRQRYWIYRLIGVLMISPLIVATNFTEAAMPLVLITMYGIDFTLGAKRWHDLNQSGWLAVLTVIPLVNLIIGCIKGTKGDNQYGPDITNI
jgi:uncharacterized membrane protein YhaH (DUF805 family)